MNISNSRKANPQLSHGPRPPRGPFAFVVCWGTACRGPIAYAGREVAGTGTDFAPAYHCILRHPRPGRNRGLSPLIYIRINRGTGTQLCPLSRAEDVSIVAGQSCVPVPVFCSGALHKRSLRSLWRSHNEEETVKHLHKLADSFVEGTGRAQTAYAGREVAGTSTDFAPAYHCILRHPRPGRNRGLSPLIYIRINRGTGTQLCPLSRAEDVSIVAGQSCVPVPVFCSGALHKRSLRSLWRSHNEEETVKHLHRLADSFVEGTAHQAGPHTNLPALSI